MSHLQFMISYLGNSPLTGLKISGLFSFSGQELSHYKVSYMTSLNISKMQWTSYWKIAKFSCMALPPPPEMIWLSTLCLYVFPSKSTHLLYKAVIMKRPSPTDPCISCPFLFPRYALSPILPLLELSSDSSVTRMPSSLKKLLWQSTLPPLKESLLPFCIHLTCLYFLFVHLSHSASHHGSYLHIFQ